jgi:hypothetical protein
MEGREQKAEGGKKAESSGQQAERSRKQKAEGSFSYPMTQ